MYTENAMISIKNLKKSYHGQKIIDDFSLDVKAPIFGFLGQNGAGKTSIMKMIVGLVFPDCGSILIDGVPSTDASIKEKIGFLPENPYFYERLTGLEFLRLCARLFNGSRNKSDDDLCELLKKVGIYDARNHLIGVYSKGMRQRLGFAETLVNDPEYLFLDEPFDGLDPIGRKDMKEIIEVLRSDGKKIFFNSHILFDVEELCDEVGVLNNGRLIYAGPVREFCGDMSLEDRFVSVVKDAVQAII